MLFISNLYKAAFFAFIWIVSYMSSTMIDNRVVSLVDQLAKMAPVKGDWVRPVLSLNQRIRFIEFRY